MFFRARHWLVPGRTQRTCLNVTARVGQNYIYTVYVWHFLQGSIKYLVTYGIYTHTHGSGQPF